MEPKTQTNLILTISFLVIIFGVGLFQAGVEIAGGENPYFFTLFAQEPTSSHLRTFENELERSSWFSQKLQPVMRTLQFLVLKETGDKALLGRDGWFFYKQDVRYLVEPWPVKREMSKPADDPVRTIVSFRDQLLARGIQLLMVPAPGKPSVYPEMVSERAENLSAPISAHTCKVMKELTDAGVETMDLFNVFAAAKAATPQTQLYLAQDTHWSPEGAYLAAQATAQRLIELGWMEKGQTPYALKPITLPRHGDVLRMVDLPLLLRRYEPETVACTQVVLGENADPFRSVDTAPVLVMGDSFLRIFELDEPKSAGFVSRLAYELQSPVTALITDGGASTLVRQDLVRKIHLLENKKVVVWEFHERDIRFGNEGWMDIKLPEAAAHAFTQKQ